MRWWKRKNEREQFFLKNGGKMLEQIMTSFNGKCNPIRSFSEEELMRATNNYDRRKLLEEDWNFCLYGGTNESHSVLVKKFNKETFDSDHSNILQLVTNEIAIASNMSSHSNFLKLLGCCLESEIPILVYEFGVNLSHEIINSLPWQTKLRIANEMANAFAYLHYGTSRMIIHRDIKMSHIYLNHDNIVKVSEFQMSVLIPLGKTHVDTERVFGTKGYLAPEYIATRRLTEKTDVFGFGVVLMEILTGKRLWTCFRELPAQCEGFDDIVQHHLSNNALEEEIWRQVIEFGELVLKCHREDPDARPTMVEVAKALKSIRNMV